MKKRFNIGLAGQISLLTLATAVTVAAGSLGVVAVSLKSDLDARVRRVVDQDAKALANLIRHRGDVMTAALNSVANGPVLKAALSAAEIDDATMTGVAEAQRRSLAADAVLLLDADGAPRASTKEMEAGEAIAGLATLSRAGLRVIDGEVYLVAAAPVDAGASRLGYIVSATALSSPFLDAFRAEGGGDSMLVAGGTVVAHSFRDVEPAVLKAAVHRLSDGVQEVDVGGVGLLAARRALDGGVEAVLLRNTEAEFAGFGGTLRLLVLVGIVCAILAGGLGIALSRRITRPLRDLTDIAARVVREGDFSQRISVTGAGEVGELASSFAEVMDKFRDVLSTLGTSAELLRDSAAELSASAAQQSEGISRQAAALQETQVTAQEIKQTSSVAAQKADAVLAVAARADEVSREGESSVESSLGALNEIRGQVDDIARKMTELDERTRLIGSITQTVKDLADQSNMLALNAAIEAVRSGEHGKGFTIVAREIRALADQSIEATNRVREILDDAGQAVRVAVSITERGAQRMETGLVQVKGTGDNLRELSVIVKDNSAAVRQIAASVSQQNAGISQIFTALSDLTKIADDSVKRLDATTRAAGKLRQVSETVSEVLKGYRI